MLINVPMAVDIAKNSIHPISSFEVENGEVVAVTIVDDDFSDLITLEQGEFHLINIESKEQLEETLKNLQEGLYGTFNK